MPTPTTIRVYRAISPKSLAALREPLARQVFRVSKYDEEHRRRSFYVLADGSWVYDNTLRRGELGHGKLVLKEEQDAREEAQKHIEYLQQVIEKFPRLHAAFAEASLLPDGLRFDRAERLIVVKNEPANPLWHWRVHYLLKFRPSGTEDYVPVEGGRCHIDLAPSGMILGAGSGILPFQPNPSSSKRFTVLDLRKQEAEKDSLSKPPESLVFAKGVSVVPLEEPADSSSLSEIDGVYAYNPESGCYAFNYLGLEGKVPGCGEAVVASKVEGENEFDPQIALEKGDDFFLEGTGEYLGRSEFGTGFEGKGLIRILKEKPEYYIKKGKKYARPQQYEYGSPLGDYTLNEEQAYNHGTSTFMAQQIFKHYNEQVMLEKAGKGIYPNPPFGYQSKVSKGINIDGKGDSSILYFYSLDQAIHMTIKENEKIHPDLNYFGMMRSGIIHEYLHLIDIKEGKNVDEISSDARHFEIYIEQIKDETFMELTSVGKYGVLLRCKKYLLLAEKNNNTLGNSDLTLSWIMAFNKLSSRTGYYFKTIPWSSAMEIEIKPIK